MFLRTVNSQIFTPAAEAEAVAKRDAKAKFAIHRCGILFSSG